MARKQILVIGGGVGGLTAAVRLATWGGRELRVCLVEKNRTLGGKLNRREIPHPGRPHQRPFRFDTGPSLLTLPQVFDDLFRAAGRNRAEELPLIRLDPIARFVWEDGSILNLRQQAADLERELAQLAPADLNGWRRFARRGREIWDLSAELFLHHAPEQLLAGKARNGDGRVGWLKKLQSAWAMLSVPVRIGMFRSYAREVNRQVRSPKLRDLLYQYATYTGSSPFRAPATLAVIPHAELHFGGWYVQGGMYRLAEVLERIAREAGVEILTGVGVKRILVEPTSAGGKRRRRVGGVVLDDGSHLPADVVVANSDVVYTYRELIEPRHRPRYPDDTLAKLEPGGSGMVLLLGIEGTYSQLAHHTKFMPAEYGSDLRAMIESRSIPEDPCIYVCASTRTDPTQAPEECENLFVLASAPALDGKLDWDREGQRYRDQLVRTLEQRWGLTDLSRRIVVEQRLTPRDLRRLYNANAGSIYGLGSNSRKAAFLRPPNRDRDVSGLYFVGGATHPGGGLPLVTLSGKIVSELIAEDLAMG